MVERPQIEAESEEMRTAIEKVFSFRELSISGTSYRGYLKKSQRTVEAAVLHRGVCPWWWWWEMIPRT